MKTKLRTRTKISKTMFPMKGLVWPFHIAHWLVIEYINTHIPQEEINAYTYRCPKYILLFFFFF